MHRSRVALPSHCRLILQDDGAVKAWKAYLANTAHFPRDERDYANALQAVPARLLLVVPRFFLSTMLVDKQVVDHEVVDPVGLGTNAVAVLLLAPPGARRSRRIIYMHARTCARGKRHVDSLLLLQQERTTTESLFTSAPACQTWYAVLVLVRAWFTCDLNLGTVDVPKPGEPVPAGSGQLDLCACARRDPLARPSRQPTAWWWMLLCVCVCACKAIGGRASPGSSTCGPCSPRRQSSGRGAAAGTTLATRSRASPTTSCRG